VVQLRPRQWLDAEEELVPIGGASAEGAPSESEPTPPRNGNGSAPATVDPTAPDEPGHASTWLGAGEETIPIAPSPATAAPADHESPSAGTESWAAADFWGEDAASVHDAVEAPVQEAPADGAVRAPRRRSWRPHRFVGARWFGGAPRSVTAPVLALAAAAIAAAAIIAAAVSGFGSAPAVPHSSTPVSSLQANTSPPSTADASAAVVTAARLRSAGEASQRRSRERAQVRSRSTTSRTVASRSVALRDRRRSAPATTAAAARYATHASTSTSAVPHTSVAPTPAAGGSAPSGAGPTGTVSLIGPGTSSSG
jgi:hypothetical protein